MIFDLEYAYVTSDFVAQELADLNVGILRQLGLEVLELDSSQINQVARLRRLYKGPGVNDLSALVLASDRRCPLVTRDSELRKAARNEGVRLRHTLELMDEMVSEGILSAPDAADALEEICRKRKKFPRTESWARINMWRS